MQEKRRYIRLDQELPLTFERKGPAGTLRGQGTTKNISPTGLCFVTKAVLGIGEKISIFLTLPNIPPLSFEGRITWASPLKAGSFPLHEVGVELSPRADHDHNQYLLFLCDLMCDQLIKQSLFRK